MSYRVNGLGIDSRADAARMLVEQFLSAGGLNGPREIAEALANPEQNVDELIEDWDLNISASSEIPDCVTREEELAAMREIDPDDFV